MFCFHLKRLCIYCIFEWICSFNNEPPAFCRIRGQFCWASSVFFYLLVWSILFASGTVGSMPLTRLGLTDLLKGCCWVVSVLFCGTVSLWIHRRISREVKLRTLMLCLCKIVFFFNLHAVACGWAWKTCHLWDRVLLCRLYAWHACPRWHLLDLPYRSWLLFSWNVCYDLYGHVEERFYSDDVSPCPGQCSYHFFSCIQVRLMQIFFLSASKLKSVSM